MVKVSRQTRRRILATIAFGGAARLIQPLKAHASKGPPEIATVRIARTPALCIAPQYVADDLLRAEGFTEIRYADMPAGSNDMLARGEIDFCANYAANLVLDVDKGMKLTALSGLMVGCFELFGNERIRGIAELRGKTVGALGVGSLARNLVVLMASEVGLDPKEDIRWVSDPAAKPMQLFVEGKVDAFLAFPPEPQELRARRIGNVLVNTAIDRPWSQYFCCVLVANPEFVRRYPVATKRAMRAILKAADMCAGQPEVAARRLVDGGFTPRYEYAVQTLRDNGYDRWREYDPEDTLRFYALRMRDAGMIKSTPQRIIAACADWRFFNELKREMKT
jgi:NitT/TauT family transport system substrate-binding protein